MAFRDFGERALGGTGGPPEGKRRTRLNAGPVACHLESQYSEERAGVKESGLFS